MNAARSTTFISMREAAGKPIHLSFVSL